MSNSIHSLLVWFSLAFLIVAIYHRLQSVRPGERLDRTKEGWPVLIGLRVAGISTFGLAGAWLWNPSWFTWAAVPVPDWVRWMGVVAYGLSVVWLMWMFVLLGRNLTDTVLARREAVFVEHGPYRWVRNPMYTGILGVSLSLGLALGTWLLPVCGSLTFTILAIRTRTEEKYLVERFGEQYLSYMKRVGRFFPAS